MALQVFVTAWQTQLKIRFYQRLDRQLGVALCVACALHVAVILGVDWPTREGESPPRPLDIQIIADSVTLSAVDITDEWLQNPAERFSRPATAHSETEPTELQEARLASDAPAAPPAQLTEGLDSQPPATQRTSPGADHQSRAQANSSAEGVDAGRRLRGSSYSELAKEIANTHLRNERLDGIGAAGKRTKRLTTTSAKSTVEAAYLEMWRQKIERIGRANYPPGGLSGELLLLAAIRQDGVLEDVRILESSGHEALDEAALRTVRLSAPFSHFPAEMRMSYGRLGILRSWRFERRRAAPR